MSAICELDEPKIAGKIYAAENRCATTPTFAWVILACLGTTDLVRGVLHTFFVQHSAVHIAGMDLTHSGQDQLMLLGAFGISNFLTGAIYLAVAMRARNLVPTVLAIIPAAYLLGFIGLRMNQISPESEFPGRTFLLVYCSVCTATWLASVLWMRSRRNCVA
jgi:hypothetical protein